MAAVMTVRAAIRCSFIEVAVLEPGGCCRA